MMVLLYVLLGLGLAVAALMVIGSRIPRGHRATSRIRLEHPPEMVWAVIRNFEDLPRWWPEVRTTERLADQLGQERYRQTLGNNFEMTLVVAESVPRERLRTVIETGPGAAFGGAWMYELAPLGAGTEVQLTEEGWIRPPLFRLMARLVGYHRTLDGYLAALARRFHESARPEHVSSRSAS